MKSETSLNYSIFAQLELSTPFFKSKTAANYFALCQNLKLFLVDVRLKTLETGLKRIYWVTLILLNARDLSKIITLSFKS